MSDIDRTQNISCQRRKRESTNDGCKERQIVTNGIDFSKLHVTVCICGGYFSLLTLPWRSYTVIML